MMSAREVIIEAFAARDEVDPYVLADWALDGLEVAGYTVAKLERVNEDVLIACVNGSTRAFNALSRKPLYRPIEESS